MYVSFFFFSYEYLFFYRRFTHGACGRWRRDTDRRRKGRSLRRTTSIDNVSMSATRQGDCGKTGSASRQDSKSPSKILASRLVTSLLAWCDKTEPFGTVLNHRLSVVIAAISQPCTISFSWRKRKRKKPGSARTMLDGRIVVVWPNPRFAFSSASGA